MMKIKEHLFFDERMVFSKSLGHFVPKKRRFNAPKKIGIGGRVPAGNDRYSLIIQKPVLVEYSDGYVAKETRVINWKTMSRYVRDRDGKCVKCGSVRQLEADHIRGNCYLWINWFFRAKWIQTLCAHCHVQLPTMKEREQQGWQKFCWK